MTSSRPIRIIVRDDSLRRSLVRRLAKMWGFILIGTRPKEILAALNTARDALNDGQLVCIFPEGSITRTGQLQTFRPGLLKILEGTHVPMVPVYLHGLWGSIFSFERGRFFWKCPRRWPYPIDVHFGVPVGHPEDVHQVRREIQELGAEAVRIRGEQTTQLVRTFITGCRRRRRSIKVADSTGAELSGGRLLAGTLVLRGLLRSQVLDPDETFVGVLLPPSAGGVLVNATLAADRRVSVNLNYTASSEVLNECIRQAGVRHVLTSRRFMEKMDFALDAELVYLEDLRSLATWNRKLAAALQTHLCPTGWLCRWLGVHRDSADDLLTVIFTSGSTGEPKGVMLTHGNIAHNVDAVEQVVRLTSRDVLVGVLPFFHSFGYTITLWAVLAIDVKGVYHFNPLEARQVGKLCQKYGGTILLATPTFLRNYTRRCETEELSTLEVVVAGAEKLPKEVSDGFEQKFGLRPIEGYGTTELSPLVSVNIPPNRSPGGSGVDSKEGTIGRPVPGVAVKVVDLDTGEDLSATEQGMLLVKGPNVMKGYLGRDDLTAEVMRDGWYVTGDLAKIDDDGFIEITGRESRFSKIGGEMVPHLKIEQVLAEVLGVGEDGTVGIAVTAVPDAKKGERLIVLHTKLDRSPDELCLALSEAGLPKLYIPSPESFLEVAELPMLGTGKLDLRTIKALALERFGP
jgi:acyl-[acyl-carrier-protein]-phospholipid O-acyltransferase/long-chain-fatty-acid--[acyl-carrier-protein] ligase